MTIQRHTDMKTIVNKIRFALLLGFIAIGMTALAQSTPNIEKMSVSTQMFLDEMAGKVSFDNDNTSPRFTTPDGKHQSLRSRIIARPDTIDGTIYISAFVRICSDNDITNLEQMGVQIQCRFNDGLLTTLIPVTLVEQVAALDGVKHISVATLKNPHTNLARQTTNVDDVLAYSADAVASHLPHGYDGSGVLLGIIDSGIDFQHIAFKDKNGNSRIKRIYRYTGSGSATEYDGASSLPTADATDSDHGTHTSSIAGGSSVIISGTNVTVTDNHANATYGGMAPGANLYLCGISDLNDTYIANAFQKICDYADSQNQPVVISNSWGSANEDHDGNSNMATVFAQYFGDSHPNHICLFAAGNEAGRGTATHPGGYYVSGTSTSTSPVGTIIRSVPMVINAGYQYYGFIANACTRATNATSIGVNIYVLNSSGAIQRTYNYTSSGSFTPTGMNGTLNVGFYNLSSGRKQLYISTSTGLSSTNGYSLAIEPYVTGGSNQIIDIYSGTYTYMSNFLTTSGHTWTRGTDDVSAGDEATDRNVISVGSYVSRYDGDNNAGDISSFSSYVAEGAGPSGRMQPWITAPGEVLISAMNHSATNHDVDQTIVNNATNPYGSMSGTSMSTPAAAGIVALWLQAAKEVGKNMTVNDIKEVMKETAIHDQWTSGANASHFGNGKINALGGIEYILGASDEPLITASPNALTFTGEPNGIYSQTVTVSGRNLTSDIIAELNDPNGVYSINRSTNLGDGGELIINYAPTAIGNHTATVILTSDGAEPITISINGTSAIVTDFTVCDGGNSVAEYLPVYGYYYDETQHNQMVYPADKFNNSTMSGKRLKSMTFYPTSYNNYSGINFYKTSSTTGTVTFKLANKANAGDYSSDAQKSADFVTVKTITMPTSQQTSLTEWKIEFDENTNFVYESGMDLILDVTTTTGQYGHTYFLGESQNNIPLGYVGYESNSGTLSWLPKVKFEWEDLTPITSGTVSPATINFANAAINEETLQTVTITNTGNQAFAPVIDTTNLPAEFTVTGNGTVAVGGTLNLTVTYTPTDAGPHSGSFTVTIGDQTYTVTVSGNGVSVTSTLTSNVVEVPVYKSDMQIYGDTYIFSESDVPTDTDMHLSSPAEGDAIQVLAKSDEPILRYELHHKIGAEGDWTYPNGNAVGIATHDGNSYVVNSDTFTFPQDATEMWISMTDGQLNNASEVTYYVPVTVANGKVTTGEPNTYGAPIGERQLDPISIEVQVGGVKSSTVDHYGNHTGEWVGPNGINYCVYMPAVTVMCQQLNGATHVPYMYRAWLLANENIDYYNYGHDPKEGYYGTTVKTMPYLLAQKGIEDVGSDPTRVVLCEAGDTYEGQNTFGAPVDNPGIMIAVRVYYQRADETRGHTLRAGGGYGFGQGSGRGDGIITGVNELLGGKQVVDVQYVNTLGMQSSEPFDGVNIVITRYSDGSTSTAKVVK